MEGEDRALLAEALRSYLEDLRDTGVEGLSYAPKAPVAAVEAAAETPCGETMDDIRADLGDCRRCRLCDGRKTIVFGSGDSAARLMFVGEGPGREEDLQGLPFVGEAGQLLTKMIEAMQLTRETVYICNVVKCRPPENRNPAPEEIAACSPFLLRQVKTVSPKVIVALGTFAAQTLLATKEPISKLRGRFHDYHGIPLMPTFHPAFLLRSPEKKREAWSDLQQVMKILVD
jgi:DNA polymerase